MQTFDAQELERDRQIDPGQLDVEAATQADNFFKWAQRSIAAKSHASRLEHDLEVAEAKLSLDMRSHPDKFGLKNATEGAFKAAVKCHQSIIDLQEELINVWEVANMLEKAVMAMEQKKRMIEVLITLHGQQYFAGPSTPRNLVSAYQEHQARRGALLASRQVARKRAGRGDE